MTQVSPSSRNRSLLIRLVVLAGFTVLICTAYLLWDAHPDQPALFAYVLSRRLPTLWAMALAGAALSLATFVFQSILQNQIVTPALLGMNALYTLLHTLIVFFLGASSRLATNPYLAYGLDLVTMGCLAILVYSYLFRKMGNNLLLVLLLGTVLTSFFRSLQSTLIRIMDPNAYDALLSRLVADFTHVNTDILGLTSLLFLVLCLFLWREVHQLDILSLGKDLATNLGLDYDRSIRRLLLGVALAMAMATALVGPISFFGLIVANLTRSLFPTYRHSLLLPASILVGIPLLVMGQMVSQHLFSYGVPVTTFISIAGGLYFLYLLYFAKGDLI